jgi:hypothetical protein
LLKLTCVLEALIPVGLQGVEVAGEYNIVVPVLGVY